MKRKQTGALSDEADSSIRKRAAQPTRRQRREVKTKLRPNKGSIWGSAASGRNCAIKLTSVIKQLKENRMQVREREVEEVEEVRVGVRVRGIDERWAG